MKKIKTILGQDIHPFQYKVGGTPISMIMTTKETILWRLGCLFFMLLVLGALIGITFWLFRFIGALQ